MRSVQHLIVTFVLVALSCALTGYAGIAWTGVNLSGGEFGGQYSVWPYTSDIDYFVSKGMNIFRIPFDWKRLQPTLNAPFNDGELTALDALVQHATVTKGVYVLLDPHNYARYGDLIIGLGVPYSSFADLWTRLATKYKTNSKVLFGLMNEPYSMPNNVWRDGAQAAVTAIRATGATNYILLPGNGWTGAHAWLDNWYDQGANPQRSNAQTMIEVYDPLNKMIFEVHQYFDSDSSGTSPTCLPSPVGSSTLTAFTNWLRQNNKKGFLGEFGVAQNADCYTALSEALAYMNANSDVWVGWTYWSAGRGWPDTYMYSLEPTNNYLTDRPQLSIMQPYLTANAPFSIPMAPSAQVPVAPTPLPGACTPGTSNVIYTDSIQAGWDNWSWAASYNLADTSLKRSGTASASFIPQGWQAIFFARPGDTFSTSAYTGVEFYINGAPNGGQQIRVGFRQGGNEYGSPSVININSYIDGATSVGNVWRRVYVPFSAMNIGPGDTLMGVTIGSETDTAQARVYIDDVRLICVGTGAPVATPVAAPVKPPTAPVPTPVAAPVKPPTTPPVAAPVKPPTAPVPMPVAAPVKPPTTPPVAAPVRPPTTPPVAPPVKPPVVAPVAAPVGPPVTPPVAPPVAPPGFAWTGITISGAEFGGFSFWPTNQDMDYFAGKGMNIFRIPFEWTRMQPILSQPFDTTESNALDAVVQYATVTKGVYVIIDAHNYARYGGLILGSGLSSAQFADFWTRLANKYKANSKVLFGLMNEAYDMPNNNWKSAAQAAINAIRATGATNYILVSGNGHSMAYMWTNNTYDQGASPKKSNAETMLTIQDSKNKLIFDVHQYFDADFSGTASTCQARPIGNSTLLAFTNWLRQNNKKGFLSEFGGGQTTNCYNAITDALKYMKANSDVWVGWTAWTAGGAWSPSYPLSLQPTNNYQTDKPQMAYLLPYLHTAGSPISVPMAPVPPYTAPPVANPPVATCTVGTINVVYADALGAGWDSWSWATVLNMSDSTRAHSGSRSVSFIPQGWQAVFFARPSDTFSTSTYSGVEFYINGAPNGGQQIRVGFRQNSNEFGYPTTVDVNGYIEGGAINNAWRRVYVPFSAMQIAPGNTLMGITIGSITDTAQARVWIDDVKLVCA